ncbi:D-glycero-beta-D-manno-heptose 1-phosphate adenylyltransferase [Arthrobacter bambusae]|uniref:D-glycero-beta-D-manno-heptose 1-phosphate adenylyltransferase n=1 Tax=Arthrobacter bambusae TaxID=1338426 RepID=UPI00277D3588|nr:D-glycero-beta-D-manno-heptose 1-phosphate adenylyltransferase [Arthrobacter bambusae]MDQ0028577.1 rfaE bifunctional protein kinase chain/domain/rfaE bifunctional protein nucleotidyltransferase chain/domain [Arthrobacter bambusae]MDQ0096629.1 rfaE bifunctional protein kinase chain/domain/rfaE bifunctional protein nucleotidyltransferase chain/domain [Arthrobacter bambusae]
MNDLSQRQAITAQLPAELAASEQRVTVVGDVILDGWWTGSVERVAREAPAPVVDVLRRDFAPGGAANTAMNLAALGAHVRLAGVTGSDEAGETLRQKLQTAGVDVGNLLACPSLATTTKMRITSGGQVLLRVDEAVRNVPASVLEELAASIPSLLDGQAALIVCDYGNGLLTGAVRDELLRVLSSRSSSLLVIVDAHEPRKWSGLKPDLVTPNAKEVARLLGADLGQGEDRVATVLDHGPLLLQETGARAVVVTLDRDGTVLIPPDGAIHRTWARPAAEKRTSGAGDTFVAALALARSADVPLTTSLDLAQAAADVVVHDFGTSVCGTAELSRYLESFTGAALTVDELERHIQAHRSEGKRIVLTNGCFDVLHSGHTRCLNQAKQLGDVLIVALNSDASARSLKGPDRPINAIEDRVAVVAALSCVDYVTVFDTPNPVPLLQRIRPDIYAKGGDYAPDMLEETPVVESYGGVVSILDYVPEHSTTALVERIRKP